MPTISDFAVCLRHWDFSETSQTVSLFTRGYGVIRGLAKGAKRARGAFSGGIDVLTKGEVIAIVKPGRDLATITAWHLVDTYRVLRQDLEANRAGLYMADLIAHMVTDHDPHPGLFDAFEEALESLVDRAHIAHALLRLQWRVLREAGYRPELERDAATGRELPAREDPVAFSSVHGGVVGDVNGPRRWRVRRETIALLRMLSENGRIEGAEQEVVDRANRLLAAYARELIGGELPTLGWAFSDAAIESPNPDGRRSS